MTAVDRFIIVMRRKAEGSGEPGTPQGRRLYVDDHTTTTARHRATLFREYELSEELASWQCSLGSKMYSISVEKVQVPEGARSLGRDL